MFGNQVRGKRQQEQQDDLRGGFVTAPAAEEPERATVQPAHHKPGQDAANRHLKEFNGRATDGKNHGSHRHCDGKFQCYQTGGVVHQRFALQDAHDFLRYPAFADDTGKGHGIRWRQDGGECKGRYQRNARNDPVNQEPYPDNRDDDQRQRQTKYLSPVFKKFTRRRFPAVGKQQRRNEQHEEQLGIELHVQAKRRPREQRAYGDLH
ncbi:hypothetical protein D3C72_1325130 [compost metagenome]